MIIAVLIFVIVTDIGFVFLIRMTNDRIARLEKNVEDYTGDDDVWGGR